MKVYCKLLWLILEFSTERSTDCTKATMYTVKYLFVDFLIKEQKGRNNSINIK